MTVIGVLLILIAALVILAVLAGGSENVTISLLGAELTMSAMSVFLLGVATVLILVGGVVLLRIGLRRSLRRRRELKEARAVVAKDRREPADHEPGRHEAGTEEAAPTESEPTASGTAASGSPTNGPATPGATESTTTNPASSPEPDSRGH